MNQSQHQPRQDLPALFWAVIPPLMLLLLILFAYFDPKLFQLMMAKDDEGGIVEHATVLVLLPGIVAGLAAFIYHRQNLPHSWLGWWILMWTLACIFFAGEEISWGQWLFEWESPEVFKQLNSQKETNLHNITPWLFQKPQALVEIWITIGGLVLPLWRRYKAQTWIPPGNTWKYWLWPTHVCIPAAAFVLLLRFLKPVFEAASPPRLERLGSGELREYYIALFLCLYQLSFWFRIRKKCTDSVRPANPKKR